MHGTSDILLAFSTASGSTPAGMGGRMGGGVANVGTGTTPGRTLAGTWAGGQEHSI